VGNILVNVIASRGGILSTESRLFNPPTGAGTDVDFTLNLFAVETGCNIN
jgi:hypothetical protein